MAKHATEIITETTICVVVNTTTLKRPLRRRLRISLEIPPHKVPVFESNVGEKRLLWSK